MCVQNTGLRAPHPPFELEDPKQERPSHLPQGGPKRVAFLLHHAARSWRLPAVLSRTGSRAFVFPTLYLNELPVNYDSSVTGRH